MTDPADEYVRDFVAGISRLKLVYAHTIMKPITSEQRPLPAQAPRVSEDSDLDALVQQFAGHNDDYYVRQFARLGESANFGLTFNPTAALFGPMWFGARNLWGWVLPFMILEIIALIPLGRGLWSDLGYEYLARASPPASSPPWSSAARRSSA